MARKRYLIISDVHANQPALEAVFRAVQRRRYEGVFCLGDLVGYGANPNPVVSRIRRVRNLRVVRGNHDKVCCGIEDGANFNSAAREAALWTLHHLRLENREYLRRLPVGPVEVLPGIWLAHGSFQDEDAYLFSDFDAYQAFQAAPFHICFFGHTHIPAVYRKSEEGVEYLPIRGDQVELTLSSEARYLINPGSVGQPRDRNARASFAEFYPEVRRLVVRRVEYEVEVAAERIRRAGLPVHLANRLKVGT
ncbi:MAG: metallophosphoesterase family protein [Acidobacteriota bacterium]